MRPGIIEFVGYSLYALAAREAAIRAAEADLGMSAAELAQGIWLLPITEAMRSGDAAGAKPFGDVFWCLTPQVEALARRASSAGLVAYLEAEIFGGDGTQAAVAWRDGRVCLEPVCAEVWMQDRSESAQWPFNRFLRELGVTRGDAFDEFDAVQLYRHRNTEDWEQAARS
jgi:hypothetical protein